MRKQFKKQLERWFLPHWIVLMADFTIICVTFFFTYFLRFNLFAQHVNVPQMVLQLIWGMPFFFLAAYIFKPHKGVLRHSTLYDIVTLAKAHFLLSTGFLVVSMIGRYFHVALTIPVSVITVHFFVSVSIMTLMRLIIQFVYTQIVESNIDYTNIMIYGAGKLGSITRSVVVKDDKIRYKIVGYLDDNNALWGSRLSGIKIYSPNEGLELATTKLKVRELILAISPSKIDIERKREIVDLCLNKGIKVKEVPDTKKWLNGTFVGNQIKNVSIDDLLGRDEIQLDTEMITAGITGKSVMVTGGAGSIGSEIVRQLIGRRPKCIIVVDQAESPLFDIQQEIIPQLQGIEFKPYVADITNVFKLRKIFESCKPNLIYHAAAYKHVPLMEDQPYGAVWNNVGGTRNLADLAIEFGVKKFVMVSTDKAVNPTNIMGTTKRICELYIQSLSQKKGIKTQFITTRFGNVLGSNGSVIPLFKKQIEAGGPVTLTHKDIIRYFMTIPEACQLVMEAGFIGNGGEIFLFDMGKPIRIFDLAVQMISLSGYIPHKEIEIKEIGLRPGEKLFEELLADKEETLPTASKKIMVAKIRPYKYDETIRKIRLLLEDLEDLDEMGIVSAMKMIVPEFYSKNSRFEVLDKHKSTEEY